MKTFAAIFPAFVSVGFIGARMVVAAPADIMPFAQQNAFVERYCAVCHSDAAHNGGLSLQHFDASNVDPSLAAMMLSKVRTGALGAAGLPIPDAATRQALVSALTLEAARSHEWTVRHTGDAAAQQEIVTASIVRDLATGRNAGEPSTYRLMVSCNTLTHAGEVQLSWSPTATKGTLHASVDGKEPMLFKVDGDEAMGNGLGAAVGPSAIGLYDDSQTPVERKFALPVDKLTISNLFPDETVVFSFGALPREARDPLSACFAARSPEQ